MDDGGIDEWMKKRGIYGLGKNGIYGSLSGRADGSPLQTVCFQPLVTVIEDLRV